LVKGRFEGTVNVSGAVMSSAFDADEMIPLALMIVRVALRPNHCVALVPARTA
jgi:hypothetical protein